MGRLDAHVVMVASVLQQSGNAQCLKAVGGIGGESVVSGDLISCAKNYHSLSDDLA